MHFRPLLWMFAPLVTVLACRSDGTRVKDSEGRVFEVICGSGASSCSLEGVNRAQPKRRHEPIARGRLLGVCDSRGASLALVDCRPLVCEKSDDCPRTFGDARSFCENSLCVDPSRPITVEDSVMACMAGTGVGHAKPRQLERYALGMSCGEPCEIPAACRQL